MKELLLYTTLGCHLCEQAQAMAAPMLSEFSFRLQPVEIADSEELMERYGIRIPVLKRGDNGQELGWPFTEQALRVFLTVQAKK